MLGYTAVLFDAGSTLWRGRKTMAEVYHEGLSEAGVDVPLDCVETATQTVA